MGNSLTTCATSNCSCGVCNACLGIDISDVPTNNVVSSGTKLLGVDSYGYLMSDISLFLQNNKPNDVITELTAAQNQISNVDVYICTGTFAIEGLTAANASRELKIISLTGTITYNTDSVSAGGTDLINGSASTTVTVGQTMVITPYSAGWNGIKTTQF